MHLILSLVLTPAIVAVEAAGSPSRNIEARRAFGYGKPGLPAGEISLSSGLLLAADARRPAAPRTRVWSPGRMARARSPGILSRRSAPSGP